MSSEVMQGERRCVAKKLRTGDRVLRSVDDPGVPAFTVASVHRHAVMTDFVEAVSDTGAKYLFWPTDTVMVETKS
jgi:hypothetical protein